MDIAYQNLLPLNFHENSKVWIYQSSRMFAMSEALQIEDILNAFIENWNSHGNPVKGFATLLFGQFVVFIADETATGVSGCSTDSSVRIVQELEKAFKVNLFDRQQLAFYVKDKIQVLPLNQLQYAFDNAFITPNTLYFNNTVLSLQEFKNNWIVPVEKTWLANRFDLVSSF